MTEAFVIAGQEQRDKCHRALRVALRVLLLLFVCLVMRTVRCATKHQQQHMIFARMIHRSSNSSFVCCRRALGFLVADRTRNIVERHEKGRYYCCCSLFVVSPARCPTKHNIEIVKDASKIIAVGVAFKIRSGERCNRTSVYIVMSMPQTTERVVAAGCSSGTTLAER